MLIGLFSPNILSGHFGLKIGSRTFIPLLEALLLSLFFFFYVVCFWPTSGKLSRLKFFFGITRRNMKKKKYSFFVIFIIYQKNKFSGAFSTFSATVQLRKPEPPLVPGAFSEAPIYIGLVSCQAVHLLARLDCQLNIKMMRVYFLEFLGATRPQF